MKLKMACSCRRLWTRGTRRESGKQRRAQAPRPTPARIRPCRSSLLLLLGLRPRARSLAGGSRRLSNGLGHAELVLPGQGCCHRLPTPAEQTHADSACVRPTPAYTTPPCQTRLLNSWTRPLRTCKSSRPRACATSRCRPKPSRRCASRSGAALFLRRRSRRTLPPLLPHLCHPVLNRRRRSSHGQNQNRHPAWRRQLAPRRATRTRARRAWPSCASGCCRV